jgi:hypothetical protein
MKLSLALALALLSIGCFDPSGPRTAFRGLGDDTDTLTAPTRPGVTPPGALAPIQAGSSLAGSLGEVRDFSVDNVEVRIDSGGRQVRLDTVNGPGATWLMTQFTFRVPLSDPSWTTTPLQTFTLGASSSSGLTSAIACVGPRRGMYTYDGSPSRVTVHVEQGEAPGSRVVTFAQYWNDGAHVVTGSFEYLPR